MRAVRSKEVFIAAVISLLAQPVWAVDGPHILQNATEFPYMVLVQIAPDPDTTSEVNQIVPGMFLSRHTILTYGDGDFVNADLNRFSLRLPDGTTELVNKRNVVEGLLQMTVLKTCYKYKGPVMPLTPTSYPDFNTTAEGRILWYKGSTGELFGHTTQVEAASSCTDPNLDAATQTCNVFDSTSSCSYYEGDPIYQQVPVLAMNSLVVAMVDSVTCSLEEFYESSLTFVGVKPFYTDILSIAMDAVQ
ncbi:uncharacterized protein LOC132202573 isoform X2 [Neocloeon triangulifer]|uniref:uncharacterized protein LOC132202573 isoform X2 n=1 Tax=Neocloeon triangulifer TaxID=2078957 RepID=UPI00286F6941|nr:uncharacterized protein LOC132202573 isoform X2 [Neocloeon triangulifer]